MKVDTVMKGYYVVPDSSWSAFAVTVFINGIAVEQWVDGNQLTPELILMIIMQDSGTHILYHDVSNGQATTYNVIPSREYVIGSKNTAKVIYAGGDTTIISAGELALIQLDTAVLAFSISVTTSKGATVAGVAGNTIPEEHRPAIRRLKAGQVVYFQMMLVRRPDGSTYRIPLKTFIISE